MSSQSVTSSLVSVHEREQNLTYIYEDTMYPEVHICSLASSEPLENCACWRKHSSHFTEPQPQNKKSLKAERERHLPMQLQSTVPLLP